MKTIIMLVVVLWPTCLWSQEIGDYVRVKAGDRTVRGTIKKMSPRYILLQTVRGKKAIGRAEISLLEKRISHKPRWREGATYGFLIGGGLGAYAGYVTAKNPLFDTESHPGGLALAGFLYVGALAAPVGAVIGLMFGDEWVIIEKPYKTACLQLMPAGVRASLRF